jgi:LPXTG-motif cell wall-anchored protein
MPLARRAAVALAVMGAGVLAYAVPATAHGSGHGPNKHCVDGTQKDALEWVLEGENTMPTGKAWVQTKDGRKLCEPVDFVLSIYKVPDTWDGVRFDESAVPQHVIEHATGTLTGGDKKLKLEVSIPTCGNGQIDLYRAPAEDNVGISGTPRLIAGSIFSVGGAPGHPASCTPPPESSSPPSESSSPPPASSSPPVESSSPPPASSSPPTESTTPPPPPSTTPAATPTTTIAPIGGAIPVVPPAQPPQLAQTGSNSTLPLVGLGSLLLASGIGLSLAGRRRRPTHA